MIDAGSVRNKSEEKSENRAGEHPAKVMVVDDHPLARRGLCSLIDSCREFKVCAEADDVRSALAGYESTHPDLMVVDITLRSGSGIALIEDLKSRGEDVRIVVLSMHEEALYAEQALRAGAAGYITKQQKSEKIIDALRRVVEGGIYLDPPFAEQFVRRLASFTKAADRSPVQSLSEREREVFELHGQGLNVREIAQKLGLSPKTVETYRENIKSKLNVRSSNELVRYAVQWFQDRQGRPE